MQIKKQKVKSTFTSDDHRILKFKITEKFESDEKLSYESRIYSSSTKPRNVFFLLVLEILESGWDITTSPHLYTTKSSAPTITTTTG